MDKQFDELSKSLAEGVSRREALRKFGIGLVGALLASAGLHGSAWAGGTPCTTSADCNNGKGCCGGSCVDLVDNMGFDIPCYCSTPCPSGTTCKKVNRKVDPE